MSAAEREAQTKLFDDPSFENFIEVLVEYGEAMVEAVVAGATDER
jgi:hypothetical protein